jgi:hypothetical protein
VSGQPSLVDLAMSDWPASDVQSREGEERSGEGREKAATVLQVLLLQLFVVVVVVVSCLWWWWFVVVDRRCHPSQRSRGEFNLHSKSGSGPKRPSY